jgi:predicted anti-sigma-YlaC factor YlaD
MFVRCREVSELLMERAHPASGDPRLQEHLDRCAACRAEEAALARAFRALEVAPGPAPDLWQQFQARVSTEMDCRAAQEQLPAYAEGSLTGTASLAMQAHLGRCQACAAEEAALAQSLRALEQHAPSAAPDLWPAMAARLAAAQTPARPAFAFRLPGWLLGPVSGWRPSLALAGVALVAATLQGRFSAVPNVGLATTQPTPISRTASARILQPKVLEAPNVVAAPLAATFAAATVAASPENPTSHGRKAVRENRRQRRAAASRRRKVRTRSTPAARREERDAPVRSAPVTRTPAGTILAALPASQPDLAFAADGSPTEMNSAAARARMMPEVVQVARLLAGMESSVERPFQEVGFDADVR